MKDIERLSVSLPKETHARLVTLADKSQSIANLVRQAIREFLIRNDVEIEDRAALTAEEVEAVIPVLKAIGHPIHVDLFLELIETQQGR